jgi:hypothetical protein
MLNILYNIYCWYYYVQVKCCNCNNTLYIDKKIYTHNDYSCNMACAFSAFNKDKSK